MPPVYGLTARTAGELRRLIADGGSIGGRPIAGSAARGSTWVKVNGAPDVDGWHPGVVSLDQAGEFEDLTAEVLVATADGSALVNGNRYLCTRTGDTDDGTARFRTFPVPSAGGGGSAVYGSFTLVNSIYFVNPSGGSEIDIATFAFPEAGVYLVVGATSGYLVGGDLGYMVTRLRTTGGAIITGTHTVEKHSGDQPRSFGSGCLTAIINTADLTSNQFKLTCQITTQAGTFTDANLNGSNSAASGGYTVLRYLKLA